jgi:hypothetical protein
LRQPRRPRGCASIRRAVSFPNEPIPDIHVREIRRALLKPKELPRGEPDMCVRKPFPRGEIAFAKPSPSHIVYGGQAEGGGGESGVDGKWLEWRELLGTKIISNFVNAAEEGGQFYKVTGFPMAGPGGLAGPCRWVAFAVLAGAGRFPGGAGLPGGRLTGFGRLRANRRSQRVCSSRSAYDRCPRQVSEIGCLASRRAAAKPLLKPFATTEDRPRQAFDTGFVHRRMKPWEYGDATSSWSAQPRLHPWAASHGRSHNEEGTCTA